jgi:hypothetical protein
MSWKDSYFEGIEYQRAFVSGGPELAEQQGSFGVDGIHGLFLEPEG